jgi:hypothetical protein
MFTCDARLLQILHIQVPRFADIKALGTRRTGQGRLAGEDRGGYAAVTGASAQSGSLRSRDPRCWTDADRQR